MRRHSRHIPDERTFGQRAADRVATATGSWPFLWGYLVITAGWLCAGLVMPRFFDRFPWPAYTCAVSVLAILLSTIILLASNRQSEVDRAHAEHAYRQIRDMLSLSLRLTQHTLAIDEKQDRQLDVLESQSLIAGQQHQVIEALLRDVLGRLPERNG